MKICIYCKIEKDLTEFHCNRALSDCLTIGCKKCNNARSSAWKKTPAGKTSHAKYNSKYCKTEKCKEIKAKFSSGYWRTSEGKIKARLKTIGRITAKIKATPNWLTNEQLKEIESIYIEALRKTKETGIKYEVDHIVPLKGENVRGLHVPWNLQILTKSENCSKNNKY